MNRPWLKFYPTDWRADPRLRMCSLAARGLWIDLMSYMHEGEPYGYLTIDGIQPNAAAIASLVGRPGGEVLKAMVELEARRVFSRAENGAIFSRRMVRDKAKAETDRENGKGGGNPRLIEPDNAGVNPPDKAHMLEARDQNPERKKEGARERACYSPEFDEQFWKPYPRTPVMSKAEAWKAWEKASDEDRNATIAAVPKYADWLRNQRIKQPDCPAVHACRFITQRRFEGFGEPEVAAIPHGKFEAIAESPELAAWDTWSRATRGKPFPRNRAGGWLVDSQWPPGYVPKKDEAA